MLLVSFRAEILRKVKLTHYTIKKNRQKSQIRNTQKSPTFDKGKLGKTQNLTQKQCTRGVQIPGKTVCPYNEICLKAIP